MLKQISERESWNRTLQVTLRGCSSPARSFIMAMILRNNQIINELRSLNTAASPSSI